MVQSYLNLDGTRNLFKYDEKRMLNEFARYITKKEQPINMAYCTDFARFILKGCCQPLYKMFHHNKMVSELKKYFVERKSELLVIFAVATYKISITSDI
jgi:inhibitor of KinA sporulation pathway (predicted exonuclease)